MTTTAKHQLPRKPVNRWALTLLGLLVVMFAALVVAGVWAQEPLPQTTRFLIMFGPFLLLYGVLMMMFSAMTPEQREGFHTAIRAKNATMNFLCRWLAIPVGVVLTLAGVVRLIAHLL